MAELELSPRWQAHALTDVGKLRTHNEDDYLSQPLAGVWAVADGMGGHHAGDIASRAVVDAIGELPRSDQLDDLVADCRTALQHVNERLYGDGPSGGGKLSGSTVVVMLVRGQRGAVLWAGDSRLYRLVNRGGQRTLSQLTHDHSKVAQLVRQGQLTEAEAESHPEANLITRAVGVRPDLDLELAEFEVSPGDTYLLCSDGLSRYLGESELANILSEPSVTGAAHSLLDATLETPARDNVTVVVARAEADEHTRTILNPSASGRVPPADDPTILDEPD